MAESPPIALTMAISPPNTAAVPPIKLMTFFQPPVGTDAYIELSSPDADEIVPTEYPQFMVGLTARDLDSTYTIEIEYASNPDFNNATGGTFGVKPVDGGVIWSTPYPVWPTTYWRARLWHPEGFTSGWTPAQMFTVSPVVGGVDLILTWSVDAGIDYPPLHLWHFDPPGAEAGDEVTAYGQGFTAEGGITYGANWDYVEISSWALIPASDNAATDDRVIAGDVVDAEHYEVVFTVPSDAEEPGTAFSVEQW